MATNKVKIQAYIKRDIFEQFEADCSAWELSHSQALVRILAERYEHNSSATDTDHNRIAALEESLEKLNRLCKSSFKLAFARIGKLEGFSDALIASDGESTDDPSKDTLGDLPILKAIAEISSSQPNNETLPHAIVLLNKRNQPIGFWRGGKDGFVESLDGARHYQGEASVKKQIAKLTKTSVLPEGTRLSYKPVVELMK